MEKGRLIIDGVDVSGSVGSAASVPYSNTNSGLEATNTQGAIDELATSVTELNSNLSTKMSLDILVDQDLNLVFNGSKYTINFENPINIADYKIVYFAIFDYNNCNC